MAFGNITLPEDSKQLVDYVGAVMVGLGTSVGHSVAVMNGEEPKLSEAERKVAQAVIRKINGTEFWMMGEVAKRYASLDAADKERAAALFRQLDGRHFVPQWLVGSVAQATGHIIKTAPRKNGSAEESEGVAA